MPRRLRGIIPCAMSGYPQQLWVTWERHGLEKQSARIYLEIRRSVNGMFSPMRHFHPWAAGADEWPIAARHCR